MDERCKTCRGPMTGYSDYPRGFYPAESGECGRCRAAAQEQAEAMEVMRRSKRYQGASWPTWGRWVALALLAALSLASTAGAQPYDSIREALWALGCRTTGVCDPVRGCPHLDIRAVDLTKDGWPGRGHAARPVHISDGSEGKGLTEAKMVAADPSNPLRLRNPPAQWTAVAGWDAIDLNIMRCGSQSARQMLTARFLPPAPPCPPGWVCGPMPPEIAEKCFERGSGWGCFGLGFDSKFCYLRQDSIRGTVRISYNNTRPECVPQTVLDGANPPPPPACRDFRAPTAGGGPVVVGADEAAAILPLAAPVSLSVRVCDLDRAALGGRQVTLVRFAGGAAGPLSRSAVAGRSRLATVTVTSDAQGEFAVPSLPAGDWWLDAGPAPTVFDVFVVEPLPPPPPPGDECDTAVSAFRDALSGSATDVLRAAAKAAEVCR